MRSKEVLRILKVTRVSLTKYVKTGKIKAIKMANGLYEYDDDSVFAFIGLKHKKKNKVVVSYARVSTQSQKNQLQEQNQRIYESCISRGLELTHQYFDIKSGMSTDRKEFQELCQRIIRGEIGILVIENKDRLIRFGFDMLEQFFKYFGTTILVLNDSIPNKSYEQELTEDLISVIHYFTMKSYSHRRKLNKLRKEIETSSKV